MIRTTHWLAAIALFTIATPALQTAQAGNPPLTGHLKIYQTPEGDNYATVAVQLNKDVAREKKSPEQLLIMVDTSASAVGEYRKQSMTVVTSLLKQLSPNTRVAVWAVDVEQTPLTKGFVSLSQENIAEVQSKLQKRIPAGATNFSAALENGLKSFNPDQTAAMVYIGDGYSAARLISPEKLTKLIKQFSDSQIPVNSYAIGAQTDLQLLGILAIRSGGVVLEDAAQVSSEKAAAQLAQIVSEKVWYPKTLQVSDNLQILPAVALPVRADRSTIYLAQIHGNQNQASVSLSDANKSASIPFDLAKSDAGHVAIRALYLRAKEDAGLSVPTAGEVILQAAQMRFEQQVASLLAQANQAVKRSDAGNAVNISKRLLQFDPSNKAAGKMATIYQVAMLQPKEAKPPAIVTELDELEKKRNDAPSNVENDLIEKFKNKSIIAGEKLSLQVDQAVQEAREITERDPVGALSVLKGIQGMIRNTNDIDPETRDQLSRKVGHVILEVRARKEKIDNDRVRFEQQLAEQEARRRVIEDMTLEEERLEQLIDQVRALIEDGKHGNSSAYADAQEVAKAAVDLAPSSGTAMVARITSVAAKHLEDARFLRLLRADRFLETLTEVEFSHVPFPDEPPVRYPPAPVWKALTERRKKWASVDLKDDSPTERLIREALQEDTEFNFVDTPLIDALQIIGEQHGINIRPDTLVLEEAGVPTDEPVNLIISGISLKSALKIMLENMPNEELTWVVEDEVMKITTTTKADEITPTRVYPVADLVIPVQTLGGQGGFGGQQGGGGQGGLGGGGQGGGGFGGGGQGGGGGGFFSIPSPKVAPAAKKKN